MDQATLKNYLKKQDRLELRTFFTNLPHHQSLDQAILNLSLEQLAQIYHHLNASNPPLPPLSPYEGSIASGDTQKKQLGEHLLSQGKAGCLIIAGGEGSRLGHSGPKGTFPLSNVKRKSLFQLFAEKVVAASHYYQTQLPLAIMVSPSNAKATEEHFKSAHYFGLKPEQVHFFVQPTLPYLSFDQQLFLSSPNCIAHGPSGNGCLFSSFYESHIFSKWQSQNVEYLNIVLIDNPLADPFDSEMIGHLAQTKDDVVIKSCPRLNDEEKVGIIVKTQNRLKVVEYHEIPKSWSFKTQPDACLSLMATTLQFAKKAAHQPLPLHQVKKKTAYYDESLNAIVTPKEPNSYKFETYIFDHFNFTDKISVLRYPRAEIFSPLKNAQGEHSSETVKKALLDKEREIYKRVAGCEPPSYTFELDAQFYYPTEALVQRWKNLKPTSDYLK